jgi:hypothetical protein
MSVDSFERNVMPEIRVVRMGALVLVPVVELERWLEGTRRRCWRRAGDTGWLNLCLGRSARTCASAPQSYAGGSGSRG